MSKKQEKLGKNAMILSSRWVKCVDFEARKRANFLCKSHKLHTNIKFLIALHANYFLIFLLNGPQTLLLKNLRKFVLLSMF